MGFSASAGEAGLTQIRQTGLQLAWAMVRVGRRKVVNTAVTAAALLSEKIGSDLIVSQARSWHSAESCSSNQVCRVSCQLHPRLAVRALLLPAGDLHVRLQVAAHQHCLLMRPSLLASQIEGNMAGQ